MMNWHSSSNFYTLKKIGGKVNGTMDTGLRIVKICVEAVIKAPSECKS